MLLIISYLVAVVVNECYLNETSKVDHFVVVVVVIVVALLVVVDHTIFSCHQ